MPDREKVIKGLEELCKKRNCPFVCFDALDLLKEKEWKDASKRPPKEGRYLVWGLHMFTPDHCDEPNAYWQSKIANWSNLWGWDTRVKYWRELPEPPMDETH